MPPSVPHPGPDAGQPRVAPWASVVDGGRLDRLRRLPSLPKSFGPPHADDVPAFDATTAYRRYQMNPKVGTGPTVLLARMTRDPDSSAEVNGPPVAEIDSRLVYLLKWDDCPFRGSGGPAAPPGGWPAPSLATPPTSHLGSQIGFIDAETGDHLGTYSSSAPIKWD